MITTLVPSCSNARPSQSSTATLEPISPTITGALPPIQTYKDLDSLKNEDPAKIDNSKFPITPVTALRLAGGLPLLDMKTYALSVDGLVNKPLYLGYDSILEYPIISEVVLLICQGAFVDNAEWTGIPVTTFLSEAGIKPEATKVQVIGIDGYEIDLNLKDVQNEGVILAYKVNGEILPPVQGYPIRLVVKGKYGSYWVKWVNRLRVQ